MRYKFYTADVFTDQIFGGNPLAVFPQASGLSDAQMKKVAKELNLSEVVFIFPPTTPQATHRLRIFTPYMELPFAGHPTIGTAYVLATIGAVELVEPRTQVVFEEGVGLVPVTIRVRNQQPIFTQLTAAQMPECGPTPPPLDEIARLISLDESDLVGGEMSPQA